MTMMQRWVILFVAVGACMWVVPGRVVGEGRYIFDDASGQWITAEQAHRAPEGVLGQAQERMDAGKGRAAEKILKKYLKHNPDAPDRAAALMLYGDCAFVGQRYWRAHKRYQRVLDEYPDSDEFAPALRRQLDIARAWLEGKKRRFAGVFKISMHDEAVDTLMQIEQLGAGHRIAEVAVRTAADFYYRTGQFELAQMQYRRLVDEYHSKRYAKLAMFRSAASALALFPGVAFDDTGLLEASELYNDYLDRFPEDARQEGVDTILKDIAAKRAEKEFAIGRFYVRTREPGSAAYYFRYVIATWPETLWAERAKLQLERMGFDVP